MAKFRTKFLAVLFCLALLFQGIPFSAAAEERTLIPGGELFGIRMETNGLLVTSLKSVETEKGVRSPAAESGLRPGDVLLRADGACLSSPQDLAKFVSKGRPFVLEGERDGASFRIRLVPVRERGGSFRAGILVRSGAGGIGTVTFYDPETGVFCGLGHGVSDPDSGALYSLKSGTVHGVYPEAGLPGRPGAPGEIRGALLPEKTGEVLSNGKTGVTGTLSRLPEGKGVPCAPKDEVRPGAASIFCTLADGVRREYAVEIEEICDPAGEAKNMILRVTDPVLLEKTGGIVQGMSGSPILQNGKLVGAVTHVLIRDPTRGYGIFLENMPGL